MGRVSSVVPVKDIVENSIQSFVTDATTVYPNFLDTAPIFVTYYSRAAYKSTHDESFEAFNEVAGSESPNKFFKIEDLPLYSLDTSDFSTEMGDQGWAGEVSSSAIILPDTVNPKTDDLIEISFHTKKYLFIVTSGTPDNFGNNKFYKINIRLSQYTAAEVDRQVDAEYKIDYDLIGKKANTLVKKNYAEALVELRSVYDQLLKAYMDQFYNTSAQCFINTTNNTLDQYLNYFLMKNALITPFVNYRNSCFISPTIDKYTDKRNYQNSFLKVIEDLKFPLLPTDVTVNVIKSSLGKNRYEFMNLLRNKYHFADYELADTNSVNTIVDIIDLALFSKPKYPENVEDHKDVNISFIYEFSRFFYNLDEFGKLSNGIMIDELLTISGKEHFENMLESISNIEIRYTSLADSANTPINDYYITPLLLFALKHLFYLISKT
jgi:hypothetical protein